ncbi:MAG: hypothetical protein Kow0077_21000 [Anaerolineae bacterium]
MRRFTVSLVVLALLIVSVVPAFAQGDKDIVDIAVEDGRFTTLVAAVQAAGLVDALKGEGPFTVFAPTDDAFAAAFDALGIAPEDLLADTETLTDILLYHVVSGKAMAADVVGLESVLALNELPIDITVSDDGVFLNDSVQVIITDIEASNGVIHVIDAVLLPPFNVRNEGTANLNFRAGPGLDEAVIGRFPVGERAKALGRDEAGEWVQIVYDGQVGWVFADLLTASGDIESLEVIRPNIVEIAVADGRFTTLVAAVQAADLVDALSGEGPFTVFAPTDDAFAAAFAALGIEPADLLADTETLTDILLYHVVSGKAMAADVVGLESVTTLQGSDISITVNDDGVFLNDSIQVIITDIEASNGVIHVIDGVLLPPADEMAEEMSMGTIPEVAAAAGSFNTLLAAVEAAGLGDALSGEGPFTVFAPTDDAFAAAFAALGIEPAALLADTETLTDILLYHVVSGKAMAADVVGLESVTTLQGSDISITVNDDGVFLNDSIQVVVTDVEADNGVIHVIDGVLLPPME